MGLSLLTVLSIVTVSLTMAYYWFSAGNRGLGLAYTVAVLNGLLCIVVNTLLGLQPGNEGMFLYILSSAWIVLMGARGLQRVRRERLMLQVSPEELPSDAELLGYVDNQGYVENSTRQVIEQLEGETKPPPLEAT